MSELIPTGFTYDQGRIAINDSFSATGYFNNIQASANITGTTYYSGATPLELIIQNLAVAGSVTHVQNGTNSFTGGTPTNPTVNITGGTFNNLNITGGTLSSGGTNLYSIFLTSAGANDITRVQPGLNTYTGGTGNNPTVNISAATLTYLSATTISGGTLYSGSTDLYDIFCSDCGFSGFSSSTGAFSIIENNGSGNIASDSYGYAGGNGDNSSNYGDWSRTSGGARGQFGFATYYASQAGNSLTPIYLDGGSLSKQFLLENNSSYYFKLTVVARLTTGANIGASASYTAVFSVSNISTVVAFIPDSGGGPNVTLATPYVDTSMIGKSINVDLDFLTGALDVGVTGDATETIAWLGKLEYVQVRE
jgi:hypothetical protein